MKSTSTESTQQASLHSAEWSQRGVVGRHQDVLAATELGGAVLSRTGGRQGYSTDRQTTYNIIVVIQSYCCLPACLPA